MSVSITDNGADADMVDGKLTSERPVTVSQALGEITWLLSQSSLHRALQVSDLAWFIMPPILCKQFHLFREGERPVGVAIWACVDGEGARKLTEGLFEPGNRLVERDWNAGEQLWLVDLVAPFATSENKQWETMFGDLVVGRFQGRSFKMNRADLVTGCGEVVEIPASLGDELSDHARSAVLNAGGSTNV